MRLLRLLRDESQVSLAWMVFLLALSGLSNALLLVFVNEAVTDTAAGSHTLQLLGLFMIAFTLFVVTRRHVHVVSAQEVERILQEIRVRIADLIRKADLAKLEKIDRTEIYSVVQRETAALSTDRAPLVNSVQALMLVFFINVYLAWLSLTAFVIFNGVILIGLAIYLRRKRVVIERLKEPLARSNKVLQTMIYVLDGFKQVRTHSARDADIHLRIQQRSALARDAIILSKYEGTNLAVFFHAIFLAALGAMVFLLPELVPGYRDVVIKVVASFFFVVGPMHHIAYTFPELLEAETAAEAIQRVQDRLEEAVRERRTDVPEITSFGQLRLEELVMRYDDPKVSHPFVFGPVNLTVEAGETVFLAGGNGSGKSTLLKLLTALYRPDEGAVMVDDAVVDASNEEAYQNLFSVIFSDFYLFDELYGLGEVDEDEVNALLEDLELAGKTRLKGGAFETLDLSTGQRKRLALLVTLLEDKPICVFDEWAAEQDPTFRRRFYREILPRLKAMGKTVIAVTHDDKYFDAADRLLQMEEGRLIAYEME